MLLHGLTAWGNSCIINSYATDPMTRTRTATQTAALMLFNMKRSTDNGAAWERFVQRFEAAKADPTFDQAEFIKLTAAF